MKDKSTDGYSAEFRDFMQFRDEIADMERNSRWYPDVDSSDLGLQALYPVEVIEKAPAYGLDHDLAMETASATGTQLMLSTGSKMFLVRDTALPSLQETAKLSGSALGRMNPDSYSRVLNEGFRISRGKSLILERYGKLSACHSGSESGYEIMPISELLDRTAARLAERFGEAEFKRGYNSHSFTEAWWDLPDAQDRLTGEYQEALKNAGVESCYAINFMPSVQFFSSDTAASCATLVPVFLMDGNRPIHFVDGIKVRHSRKGAGITGMQAYENQTEEIYSRFSVLAETVRRLAGITVMHPENCVISLCRRYNIAKKYGEAAREEVCRFAGSSPVNAHDLYLGMTMTSAAAKECGASSLTVNNIDEALGKIAMLTDFREHDVGGTVAWA